jgi:hypothetical protein
VRHRAPWFDLRYLLECLPRLRVGHVVKQGDRAIELDLGLFGAGDGEVNRAQGVLGVTLHLPARLDCSDTDQDHHEHPLEARMEDRLVGRPRAKNLVFHCAVAPAKLDMRGKVSFSQDRLVSQVHERTPQA